MLLVVGAPRARQHLDRADDVQAVEHRAGSRVDRRDDVPQPPPRRDQGVPGRRGGAAARQRVGAQQRGWCKIDPTSGQATITLKTTASSLVLGTAVVHPGPHEGGGQGGRRTRVVAFARDRSIRGGSRRRPRATVPRRRRGRRDRTDHPSRAARLRGVPAGLGEPRRRRRRGPGRPARDGSQARRVPWRGGLHDLALPGRDERLLRPPAPGAPAADAASERGRRRARAGAARPRGRRGRRERRRRGARAGARGLPRSRSCWPTSTTSPTRRSRRCSTSRSAR